MIGFAGIAFFLFFIATGQADFLIFLSLAGAIFGAALSQRGLYRFLGSKPMVWLGEVSYSIYMVHYVVLNIVRKLVLRFDYMAFPQHQKLLIWLLAIIAVDRVGHILSHRTARAFASAQHGRCF